MRTERREIRLLFGVSLWFKLLYFFTAMMPAYFIMIFKIITIQFYNELSTPHFMFITIVWLGGFIAFAFLGKFSILMLLNRDHEEYGTDEVISEVKIIQVNGDIVPFVIGVILPTVLLISEDLLPNVMLMFFIQIMIFKLFASSSGSFPNISLILFGVNIYSFDDQSYLLSDQEYSSIREDSELEVSRIGESVNLYYSMKGD